MSHELILPHIFSDEQNCDNYNQGVYTPGWLLVTF